ncbi:MAG: hypothetical protein HS122_08005 [Opitutaceae bacterium]|nr:hypothetical protein [Opitutaceae bacterium]
MREPVAAIDCFLPANPAARRIVRDGELLVHGVRLNETEFRNDPAWPATTSSVATLLKSVPCRRRTCRMRCFAMRRRSADS